MSKQIEYSFGTDNKRGEAKLSRCEINLCIRNRSLKRSRIQ
jgi:hypothetical protein